MADLQHFAYNLGGRPGITVLATIVSCTVLSAIASSLACEHAEKIAENEKLHIQPVSYEDSIVLALGYASIITFLVAFLLENVYVCITVGFEVIFSLPADPGRRWKRNFHVTLVCYWASFAAGEAFSIVAIIFLRQQTVQPKLFEAATFCAILNILLITFVQMYAIAVKRAIAVIGRINGLPQLTVESENDEDCVICIETLAIGDRVSRLPCNHIFHTECIEMWLIKSPSCPLCLQRI